MSQLFQTGIVVSKGNSTNIPLAANETFLGTIDDVTSYEEVDITVAGSPNNAPGSLYFEFSNDGINWDISVLVGGAPYYGPNIVPQFLRIILPYFRVKYVNGNIDQTELRLITVYHRTDGMRLTRYLNQNIDNTEGVQNTRAVIAGINPDGYYRNIEINSSNAILIDGSSVIQPVSGTVTANAGSGTFTVGGTVTANAGTGNFTVVQGTAANLNATVVGTVTANIGTTNGLALDNTLTDGYQTTRITDGTSTVTVKPPFLAPAITDEALVVAVGNNNLDAFSRLRVSDPKTLFDSKQLVDNQPLFWDDQQTSGSGTTSTYNTNQSSSTLAVSLNTAGTRVRQTFQRFNYQPGKSILLTLTGVLGNGHTGVTKRIGYFDGYNGVFFQLSGTTLSTVIRSNTSGSPVDTVVTQANWNLDKLDGTGPSGITLDTTKTQIFVIDFQWLGVGRIRFGFDIGGSVIYANQVNNSNINTIVYMSIPNLPVRYEISATGTNAAASLVQICATVISEGGREQTGPVFAVDNAATALTTLNNANIYPLIAIRLKSTYQMATIDPLNLEIINTSGDSFRYCLLLNPTITGTALSFSGVNNSAIEVATPTNATTVSAGTQISSGYTVGSGSGSNTTVTPVSASIASDLRLGSNIAGVSDIMVLGVQRISGTTVSFFGSFSWREQI